tara:strand:+ start:936 stop:1841 length:906 start_codon:yes stop_codon:yes gene_type:complete
MGTPEFAVPILKSIYESENELLSVYTQPAKKKARGQKIIPSPIQEFSEKKSIPFRCPEILNNDKEYNYFKALNPNIVIVVAYGKIIPKRFLELSETSFINIHASLLPKWRGAAPIQRAIMNMDKETGISIMKIANELDAGPIMQYFKIKITNNCNYENLSKKMSNLASSKINEILQILEKGNMKFTPQDHTKATYAKKIKKFEAKINWNDEAKKVVAKINALHPNPGAWFEYSGSRIKIIKAKEVNGSGEPGKIIDKNLTVACSKNAIEILELKKEGKKTLSTSDFLRGYNIKIGTMLNDS